MTEIRIPGYRVLRTLGVGGMATVYLAEQESLEREVALKVMAPALAANADFCQQFLKEGRITAKLSHPNLVTVHDIGSHNGTYYMASEYLPAGSLRERMQRRMDVATALAVVHDVASGLNYAHEMGFVHRDVKPGNILFRANGSAVLADFGIAKAIKSISSATMAGNAIGTPDYMSPEQAQATLVDGRTDIYSLGAVLFEMLTGRKPYVANDPYVVALRHVTEPVPQLPDELAWLQPLVDSAMAKDREQRFASGGAFIAECEALLSSHPEFARRPPAARRPVASLAAIPAAISSVDRTRLLRALVPAAAALVFIVAATVAWRWSHRPPVPQLPVAAEPRPVLRGTDVPDAGSGVGIAPNLAQRDTSWLLARASSQLRKGLADGDGIPFAFPDGDNAIDLFQEVLRRDPGNAVAAKGLATIADFYQKNARGLLDRGMVGTSADLVDKGLRAQPDNADLLKLKSELASRASARAD